MPRKLTQEEFIKRAREVHGDKYDYSKVEYINANSKVCIICPEHGEFWQTPANHLLGCGCIECAGKKKYNKKTFIEKARKVHGDKYDYSKVEYVNNKTKVCIICPEHGEFWQKPESHIVQKRGCPYCGGTAKLTLNNFIRKSDEIHKHKYNYSKVEYVNYRTKVCVICPEHGEFWQTPHAHLNGQGCPYCNGNIKLTTQDCIKRAKEKHFNKYDYSKFIYNGYDVKSCIICPEHGEFWQTPHAHLLGCGCPKCCRLYQTTEDFIEKAREVHGDKYDYSKVEYVNNKTKVCIICPEHGEFWQNPNNHLHGQNCPYCKNSFLENEISILLKENKITYEQEKTFEWLRDTGCLYLDFYLPDYNIAIECQGEQHFKPVDFFGGEEQFKRRQELDFIKHKLCINNGIKIIYYSTIDLPYFAKVENNKEKILNLITKKDG